MAEQVRIQILRQCVVNVAGEQHSFEKGSIHLISPLAAEMLFELGDAALYGPSETAIETGPVANKDALRLAEAAGVSLSKIVGTGPGGRILKSDVEVFLTAEEERKAEEEAKLEEDEEDEE